MVTFEGEIRIIDFGIVRALDETQGLTRTGIVMGSLGWAAPEQMEGASPAPAMDVFSWGCVVAFAATAAHPFGPGGLETRAQRMLTTEPAPIDIPEPLRSLVAWSLRREPASRPTAQELLLALISGAPPARRLRLNPAQARHHRKALTALVMTAPLAAALVFSVAEIPNGDDVHPPADDRPTVVPVVSGHPSSETQQPSTGYENGGGSDTSGSGRLPPVAGPGVKSTGAANPATPTTSPPGNGSATSVAVPTNAPTSAEQCKNDGWKIFTAPSFKNQGQCVSYVEAK